MSSQHIPRILLVCALCLTFTACVTPQTNTDAQKDLFRYPTQSSFAQPLQSWLGGDNKGAKAAYNLTDASSIEDRFLAAEIAYWDGDVERAFDFYADILKREPGHVVARFAASRLHELHSQVTNWHERAAEVIAPIRFSQLHPLTAVSLSMIGQRIGWYQWNIGKENIPYSGNKQGLPTRWRITPKLSSWRLLDFDRPFDVEKQSTLKDKYLSTYIAEDDPSNYRETLPYISGDYSLNPRLPGSGIYYLETFATVEGDSDQVFFLYGSFPSAARVFIDGVEVLERREGDYASGKRLRRVTLSPGTHRVLVKLAYQRGYRDWFDLNFLNKDATALSDSRITFHEAPKNAANGKVIKISPNIMTPLELEPVAFTSKDLDKNSDMEIYLRLLATYDGRDARAFKIAYDALVKRHPKFAALHGMLSDQVRTLWQVPSRLRDATALKELRAAQKLDPRSLKYTIELGNWLRKRGKTKEVRILLENSKKMAVETTSAGKRLKNIMPLHTWATHLESQGWDELAESAWKEALAVAPKNCGAAGRLQSLYHSRGHYPKPETYYKYTDSCPKLQNAWLRAQPQMGAEKLALAKKNFDRNPDSVSSYVSLAAALRREGKLDEADAMLKQGLERLPFSSTLRRAIAKRVLAEKGQAEAIKLLESINDERGYTFGNIWRLATLRDEIPLSDLLQDGVAVAKSLAAADAKTSPATPDATPKKGTEDEAFYAIDFAAIQYLPDGSSVHVTHTMVRVMTKGAIDRFAEVTVPRGARVIRARTVKKDGSVRVPETTSGKSTLSMPGLAEGDFVELAYLEFHGPPGLSRTNHAGTKFFFRMSDISSLRSEFVVINPPGEFYKRNDAPKTETFEYKGQKAVRFLRKNSPRPRAEPHSVPGEEHLPWVQLYKKGLTVDLFEVIRRNYREKLLDVTKTSAAVETLFSKWIERASAFSGEDRVKKIFYEATAHFPKITWGYNTDISHAILTKEGNPMIILYEVFKRAKIPADIFLVRSSFRDPNKHPLFDANTYDGPVLRVKVPGEERFVWLAPNNPDSMYNAVSDSYLGQPAMCITCEESVKTVVPDDDRKIRRNYGEVQIKGELDAQGTLTGVVNQTFDGPNAAYVRSVLRQRKEQTTRQKLMEAIVAQNVPGATVEKFEIVKEKDPESTLTLKINFKRPGYATVSGSALVIQTPLFREQVASIYAALPSRSLPLFVSAARNSANTLEIKLPKGKTGQLRSKSGAWSLTSNYGDFDRDVAIEDGVLKVRSSFQMPIQRIPVAKYADFQRWAISVEQSSILVVSIQ